MRAPAVALILALVVAGCSQTGVPMSSPSPSTPRPSLGVGTVAPPSGSPIELDPARWQAIKDDLTSRGVAADQARVLSAQAVTFNDGSWGCPRPGVVYTQALVDGQRVLVEAGGKTWDYRFGTGVRPRLCESPR